jgi:hypothetical protein
MSVVTEPNIKNSKVLEYEMQCGFNVEKWVDLPHKRSAAMRCLRERFFQIFNGTGGWEGKEGRRVGGTGVQIGRWWARRRSWVLLAMRNAHSTTLPELHHFLGARRILCRQTIVSPMPNDPSATTRQFAKHKCDMFVIA